MRALHAGLAHLEVIAMASGTHRPFRTIAAGLKSDALALTAAEISPAFTDAFKTSKELESDSARALRPKLWGRIGRKVAPLQ